MKASDRIFAFIREKEGFREKAYLDSVGIPTIGYGATHYANGHPVRLGETITREAADVLLYEHIHDAEEVVRRMVDVPLTQGQYDALISFIFNLGPVKFQASTLLKMLNRRDYLGAGNQFERWVYAKNPATGQMEKLAGLKTRRKEEKGIFNET